MPYPKYKGEIQNYCYFFMHFCYTLSCIYFTVVKKLLLLFIFSILLYSIITSIDRSIKKVKIISRNKSQKITNNILYKLFYLHFNDKYNDTLFDKI